MTPALCWRACEVFGISVRTLERWGHDREDGRHAPKSVPSSKRSAAERQRIVAVAPSTRYLLLVPSSWVSPRVLGPVVAFALERGLPARQLARFVPLEAQGPVAGDSAHALWSFVARSLDERALPWRVAGRMRTADYGPYGFALQASETAREALLRAARLLPAIATTIEFHLTSTARAARLTVHRRDAASSRGARIGTSFVVGQVARLLHAISDGAVTPSALRLSDASDAELAILRTSLPSSSSASPAIAPVPVARAATTSVEFSAACLDRPLPRRDPDLAAYFDEQLSQSLGRSLSASSSLRAAVLRTLDEHFAAGRLPTEERVAAALALATRTLRRRLAAEGTSLRALLDEARRERAVLELTRGDLPLVELAGSLGFSDQSAFSRAFTRWTGRSPRAYRLRHAAANPRIFGSDLAERG